jgi:two-component system, sensor histidine kinase and response regulator
MDTPVLHDRILIVDDDPMVLRVIGRSLRQAGYVEVHALIDSSVALEEFDRVKPDLLLLDLQMPRLDGFDVMARLRPRLATEVFLPVLVLTGNIDPEAKQRALGQGANDFLTKPFDRVELLLRVRNLLQTRSLYRQLQTQNQHLETLVRERTHELELALGAAEAASQAKTDFLSMMSHELKTPLTSIISYAELLQMGTGGSLSELHQEQVSRIGEGAWHLNELVEEILDFARGTNDHLDPDPEDVDLAAIARQVVGWVAPSAAQRNLKLHLALPPGPAIWETDANWVRRILLNLLSNAVKFTEQGSVSLRLEARPEAVEFLVEDTGIGIDPEHWARIWDPFWQVAAPSTRREGGMGLGLSLVRRLTERLGGEASVRSAAKVGSSFRVRLPRMRS